MRKNDFEVKVSAGICLDREGTLLLVKQRETGQWGIPAGGMDPNETINETVWRELNEETGLKKDDVQGAVLMRVVTIVRSSDKTSLGLVFRGETNRRTVPGPSDPEIETAEFFTRTEVHDILIHDELIYKPEFNKRVLIDWCYQI